MMIIRGTGVSLVLVCLYRVFLVPKDSRAGDVLVPKDFRGGDVQDSRGGDVFGEGNVVLRGFGLPN